MCPRARKRLVARFCAFLDLFKLTWPPAPLSWFDLVGFCGRSLRGKPGCFGTLSATRIVRNDEAWWGVRGMAAPAAAPLSPPPRVTA